MDKDLIVSEIKTAMKAHDRMRLSILRQVKNEVDIREKDGGQEATDEEVTGALKRVLKQTSETLEGSIKAATNAERTAQLKAQVEILAGYLPAQTTGAELEALVDHVIADSGFSDRRDMGRAIGLVVSETAGNVDKAEVARLVGERLA